MRGVQALLAQTDQQVLHRGGVLGRSELDAQHVLATGEVHAHRGNDVMRAEPHAVDVDHQDLDLLPTPLQQLFQERAPASAASRLTADFDTPTLSAMRATTSR